MERGMDANRVLVVGIGTSWLMFGMASWVGAICPDAYGIVGFFLGAMFAGNNIRRERKRDS